MPASFTIPSIFTAIDKFSAPVKKMGASTARFASKAEANLGRGERAFRKLTSPLQKLNRLLGGFGVLIGSALIVSALTSAVKVVRDFEQANADLSAVMATASGPQLKLLSEDAKRLGATTAKSATDVVSLQEAFARLGFETPAIINMTEATIAGSIAMNAELSDTAELVGAMVRTFDDFSSIDTPTIIDQMTTATQKSALNFEKLQTSLPIVAGAANAAGIPFTKLLALLGKLSDSGIDASSSSTALRNIFLESAKQGLNYSQILTKIVKSQDSLTAANDEFGKRAAVSGVILAKNLAATDKLAFSIQNAINPAAEAAKKRLATMNGALTILESSYQGFILSIEDGTGAYAETLTMMIMVVSQMFSLASGVEVATSKLTEQELKARSMAKTGIFLLKAIGLLIGSIIAFKVVLIASRIALAVYNISLGIAAAANGVLTLSVAKNSLALGAYKVVAFIVAGATKLFTAAQWLLNIALNANPIGLVVLGIAALIGIITLVINKYNTWGAALSLLLGPLGFIINLIQSFRRNWDMIKDAFSEGGIKAGLLAIGKVILDAILMPLQQVFQLMTNLPGVGDFASKAVAGIEKFRSGLGVNVTTDESGSAVAPAINPEVSKQESLRKTIDEQRQNVSIDINDKTGQADVTSDNEFIPINLTSTFGLAG
jgi:hypothetical protein